MATKKEVAELVINLLEGGDNTTSRRADPREIYVAIDMVIGQLIKEDMNETRGDIDGRFFSPSQVLSVNYNQSRNRKYTTLLAAPLLGFDGSAIVLINPVQGDGRQFIMGTPIEEWMTNGLEVSNVQNTISFHLENKTVFYRHIPSHYTQVLVRQVSSVTDLAENVTIPVPDHLQAKMLQMLLQLFGVQQESAMQQTPVITAQT